MLFVAAFLSLERHQKTEGILAAGIVDDVLDSDEGAPGRQRRIGLGDQHLLDLLITFSARADEDVANLQTREQPAER